MLVILSFYCASSLLASKVSEINQHIICAISRKEFKQADSLILNNKKLFKKERNINNLKNNDNETMLIIAIDRDYDIKKVLSSFSGALLK